MCLFLLFTGFLFCFIKLNSFHWSQSSVILCLSLPCITSVCHDAFFPLSTGTILQNNFLKDLIYTSGVLRMRKIGKIQFIWWKGKSKFPWLLWISHKKTCFESNFNCCFLTMFSTVNPPEEQYLILYLILPNSTTSVWCFSLQVFNYSIEICTE